MPIISEESGDSDGFTATGCVFTLVGSTLDIHAVAQKPLKWSHLVDNIYDFNALAAVPAAMGLSAPLDGSTANITTTVAGVWAFTLGVLAPANDATIVGYLLNDTAQFDGVPFGPIVASPGLAALSETVVLPSGVDVSYEISTVVGATANPYNVTPALSVVRLA